MEKNCPCQSDKIFQNCCEPLLNGSKIAKTPVQLMRSRYTAYALGGYGDYLLATWIEHVRVGLAATSLSLPEVKWLGLEVVMKSQNGDTGMVEFKAVYSGKQGEALVYHEKSVFNRVRGEWFYVGENTRDEK